MSPNLLAVMFPELPEELRRWRRKRRIINWIIIIIGILLIVIGAILKYGSPPLIGDIASVLGLALTVYGLITSHQDDILFILSWLRSETSGLREGVDELRVGIEGLRKGVDELREEIRRGFERLEKLLSLPRNVGHLAVSYNERLLIPSRISSSTALIDSKPSLTSFSNLSNLSVVKRPSLSICSLVALAIIVNSPIIRLAADIVAPKMCSSPGAE